MSALRHAATIFALGLLFGGCATVPQEMAWFPAGDEPPERVGWPGPPEPQRLVYAGELVGESNFRRAEGAEEGSATRLLRWIVGLGGRRTNVVELVRPQSGMVDGGGRILVTDAGREGLLVFDEAAGRLLAWNDAGAGLAFRSPVGIAGAADGSILVADSELGYVVRLDAEGRPIGELGRGVLTRPTGLARDPSNGELYVADTAAHDIKVFDDTGSWLRTLGRHGAGPGEFNGPTHLCFAHGRLYVTDTLNSRVQVLAPDGSVLTSIGQRGLYLGNLVRPKGVVADRDGNVYVIESYYDHLLVFNASGELLLPIGGSGSGAGQFFLPAGAWTDNGQRLFVADMFNGRIVVIDYVGEPG